MSARVGVRYLGEEPSVVVDSLPFQVLLINVSDREMLFGVDADLGEHVRVPRYGMLLVGEDVPKVFGMTIRSKLDRSRMLFVATDDQDAPDGGAIYSRQNRSWVPAISRRERA